MSSIGNFDLYISSKPSAYACMIPYSTPLWTIFTKCPAPAGPKWRQPSGGASTWRTGASRSTDSWWPPTIMQ